MANHSSEPTSAGPKNLHDRARQSGLVHFPIDHEGPASAFVFALVPKFSMHSFSAAVEPLRIANQLTGKALYHWETRSVDGAPVMASNGLSVSSDGLFGDLPSGAFLFACSGDNAEVLTPQPLADWVRAVWRRGHVVGGLCTGAYALHKAGILQGHDFTLHWECQAAFEENHPGLSLRPSAFVVDRRIMTSAGGVASTDLILHMIEQDFGRALRIAVADMCLQLHVRSPQDMQRSLTSKAFGLQNPKLSRAIEYLERNLKADLDINEWAGSLAISRRQLERMFVRHTGLSPKKFATDLRLDRAYSLLIGTQMPLVEIADAAGLAYGNFTTLFKRRFGVLPRDLTRQAG